MENKLVPIQAWLLLALLGSIWGSAYFLMQKGLEVFSPIQMASLRMTISFVCFLPIFLFQYRKIPWSNWRFFLVVGMAGSVLPALFFALAQTRLISSITGVLASTTPLFTLLVGMLFFAVPYFGNRVLGVLLGLAGTLFIIIFGEEAVMGGELTYAILPTLATICYAISTNVVKSKLQAIPPLTISTASFVLVGPFVAIVLWQSGFFTTMQLAPRAWEGFGYVMMLSLSATVISSVIYFRLVQLTSAVFASTVAYIIPLVATLIGAINGEPITWVHGLGLVFILGGVYLSRR